MNYQVLARKWRPQRFGDLIGQGHVVTALTNALDNNRLHHAYLFTGMRGVGKTTIARVFAKSLNCEANGVSSEPCGECTTCQDIEAGRFFDLIEVDAASRTRVEETRELLENVPYAPASGRFKVYLIDEVHMFSTHSFNALLKTLEEPPEHVKFLLATTDPQKVPVTILSRCLQFNLKSIPATVLTDYLASILEQESIPCEAAALAHIARASEGSVRDSLSLVEQAAAFGEGQVRTADVEAMLGRLSTERVVELLESVAAGDAALLLQQVEALAEYAPDYSQLLAELLSLLHKIALQQTVDTPVPGVIDAAQFTQLCQSMAPADVQLYYQIGLHGRRDMPYAPDQREALEMTLLRMLAFKPAGSDDTVSGESPAISEQPSRGSSSPEAAAAPVAVKAAQEPVAAPAGPEASNRDGQAENRAAPTSAPARKATTTAADKNASPASGTSTAAAPQPSEKPSAIPEVTAEWIPENWTTIVEQLGISGMPKQLASHCALREVTEQAVVLEVEAAHEHLNSERFAARLQQVICAALGRELLLRVETAQQELTTPARVHQQRADDALAAAHSAIQEDPVVRSLLQRVDGVVDEDSVKPVDVP
ncbi:MAG: DNA polymerase III subunit gamma/tau [Gammaproteobacteria bacterium]|nr:DNA polymerase III subunit gamma/tau [Gammaproteobacteria bacterium]